MSAGTAGMLLVPDLPIYNERPGTVPAPPRALGGRGPYAARPFAHPVTPRNPRLSPLHDDYQVAQPEDGEIQRQARRAAKAAHAPPGRSLMDIAVRERQRSAHLAQTYMPATRNELRQIVRMRAPKTKSEGLADNSGSSYEPNIPEVVPSQLAQRPVSAAMGRTSASRREAALVARCYEAFLSEGTDPQVALHAARAHAIGARERAAQDAAQRRRIALRNKQHHLPQQQPPPGRRSHDERPSAPAPAPAALAPAPAPASARPFSWASRPDSAARATSSGGVPNDALRPFGYQTLGPIAAGAFSQVSRARNLESHNEVAVKTFLMKVKAGRRPDVEVAQTEIECLKRVQKSSHPHIANLVELFDGKYETHAVLVYCAGGSLLRHLQTRGHGVGVDEKTAAIILTQIASALAHMHSHGVTHRDVKPSNIVFDDTKRVTVRIVDFGFAQMHLVPKAQSAELVERKLKTMCGSPAYMSPELQKPSPYAGPPVDIWALGCVGFEMLHNRPAFRAQSIPELNVRIIRCKHETFAKHVSTVMREIIKKALTVDVSKREDANGLVEILKDAYDLHSPAPTPRDALGNRFV